MVEILREFLILLRVLQNVGFSVHLAVVKTDIIMVIASIYSGRKRTHLASLRNDFTLKKIYA